MAGKERRNFMIPSEKIKEKQIVQEAPQEENILTPENIATGGAKQRLNDLKNKERFIFNPHFIPYYLSIKKDYDLSHLETLIYGFIYFYLANVNNKFYFSNEHLAKMLEVSENQVSISISELKDKGLIIADYEIKANGGKMRYVLLKETPPKADFGKTQSPTLGKPKDNNNKINDNKLINIYTPIFDYWNSKKIVIHKCLTESMKRAITRKVNEGYTLEDIKKTFDNYEFILKDDKYFFKYKWALQDFLYRGFEKFCDLDTAKANYLGERRSNAGYKSSNTAEKGKYDDIIKR